MLSDHKKKEAVSHSLASGISWNFLGQSWLIAIAFFATPYIVHHLKPELYGVYALVGIIVGYFSFLEFGLSMAATRYISQYLAREDQNAMSAAFWSCAMLYLLAGLLSLSAIWLSAGFIVLLLKIPAHLRLIAIYALRLGSVGFVLSLYGGLASGVLRSIGKFKTLNKIAAVMGTIQTASTVLLLYSGYSLLEILIAIVSCQLLMVLWQWDAGVKELPFLKSPHWDKKIAKQLLQYGVFITISGIAGQILSNVEKLFLTRLSSVAMLTFYSVPFSLVDRLAIIPSSFGSVLFPSYSYYDEKDRGMNKTIHYRGTLYIFLIYAFFAIFFIMLGKAFLATWMGGEFAAKSATVLGISAVGGMFNAMARPAVNALQGIGKPRIPMMLNLCEVILYVPLGYLLIKNWGMVGAAWAVTIRVTVDAILLHIMSCLELKESILSYLSIFRLGLAPIVFCVTAFWLLRISGQHILNPLVLMGIASTSFGYCALIWKLSLDGFARAQLKRLWVRIYAGN